VLFNFRKFPFPTINLHFLVCSERSKSTFVFETIPLRQYHNCFQSGNKLLDKLNRLFLEILFISSSAKKQIKNVFYSRTNIKSFFNSLKICLFVKYCTLVKHFFFSFHFHWWWMRKKMKHLRTQQESLCLCLNGLLLLLSISFPYNHIFSWVVYSMTIRLTSAEKVANHLHSSIFTLMKNQETFNKWWW